MGTLGPGVTWIKNFDFLKTLRAMPDTSASSLLKALLSSIFGFIPHPTKNLLFFFPFWENVYPQFHDLGYKKFLICSEANK